MAPVNRLDELEKLEKEWRDAKLPSMDRAKALGSFQFALFSAASELFAVARAAETLLALMDFADKTCGGKEELRAALDKLMEGESL